MKINGIVLAAGFGSRLAPLTHHIPKPLLPMCGEPMLLRTLKRLKNAGVSHIAVNTHHLHEQIETCIRNSEYRDCTTLFHEETILGTAGPLINAKKLLLDCDYFVLHNADVVSDFDLSRMIREHAESGASLTMAMIDGPENRVQVKDGQVRDILHKCHPAGIPDTQDLTYACISVFSPDFFEILPETVQYYSFLDAWIKALNAGKKINVFSPDPGYFWSDIGSFHQYFEAHRILMKEQPLICGNECNIASNSKFTGFNVIGDHCTVPDGAHLHNCILLDGAEAESGYSGWKIFGNGFNLHKDQKQLMELPILKQEPENLKISSLQEQGSDRQFFRVSANETKKILMISRETDRDFERFLSLGSVFHKYSMRTPEIYRYNREDYTVLMEDLGDNTLYNLGCGAEDETLFRLYSDVLTALADFQKKGELAIGSEDLSCRIFSRKLLRWESEYFFNEFLGGICEITFQEAEKQALSHEFELLAEAARKLPYVPVHRDFQSQNILFREKTVRFVDFQGFRLGPYTYDLAALIKDPYMNLSKPLRDQLYRFAKTIFSFHDRNFETDCLIGALQRNMQALGAYGFLSMKKGKKKYLDYAEPCLNILYEGAAELVKQNDMDFRPVYLTAACEKALRILPERIKFLKGI